MSFRQILLNNHDLNLNYIIMPIMHIENFKFLNSENIFITTIKIRFKKNIFLMLMKFYTEIYIISLIYELLYVYCF